MSLQPFFDVRTLAIAAAGTVSASMELRGGSLTRVIVPSGWTTAVITLQGSQNGADFFNLFNEFGGELSLSAVAGGSLLVPLEYTLGLNHVRLRSGTLAVAVPQASPVSITAIARSFQ